MKRNSGRALSIILALMMLFSTMSFAASADDELIYTALGDSNASGYGMDAYLENAAPAHAKEGDLIEGSYVQLFSEAIGADKVNVCTHCAWRSNEFLRATDPSYQCAKWDNQFFEALGFVTRQAAQEISDRIAPAVKEADVITVNYGSNDLFTQAIVKMSYDYDFDAILDIDMPEEINEESLSELFMQLLSVLGAPADILHQFELYLGENLKSFEENMPKILDYISAENPDAEVYVLGVFNPLNLGIATDDGDVLSLITTTDILMATANSFLMKLCAQYENCTFVDVGSPECYGPSALDLDLLIAGDDDVKFSALKVVHPNEKGHEYIANCLIESYNDNHAAAPVLSVTKSKLLKKNILKWEELDGAAMYRVYRSSSADGTYSYIGSACSGVFYDGISLSSRTYYYKVCAVMDYTNGIYSPMSNIAKA